MLTLAALAAASATTAGAAHANHGPLAIGQTLDIGGNTYSSAQVGTLAGYARLEGTAPFAGLTWDTIVPGSGGSGFSFIAGAMFTGSPEVNLHASGGSLFNDSAFQNHLAIEEQNLQSDVDD